MDANTNLSDVVFDPSIENVGTSGLCSGSKFVTYIFESKLKATIEVNGVKLIISDSIRGTIKESDDEIDNANTRANSFCETASIFAYEHDEWQMFKSGKNLRITIANKKDFSPEAKVFKNLYTPDDYIKNGLITTDEFEKIVASYRTSFSKFPMLESDYLDSILPIEPSTTVVG